MFRTFLMTVLAVVAIGFGAVSTAEAGGGGNQVPFNPHRPFKGRCADIHVWNSCQDNLHVYTMWFGNPLRVDPWTLDLAGLLALGARPVTPGPYATQIGNLVDNDGYLLVVDGIGGNMVFLPVTLEQYPASNHFEVKGLSTDPVVVRY